MPNNLPPAINSDGSVRHKNDPYDYGLNEYDAETEYHKWLEDLKDASNYSPPKRKYKGT
jgi:hypothetical protein